MDSILRSKLDEQFDLVRRVPLIKLGVLDRSRKTIKNLQIGSVLKYSGVPHIVTDRYSYYGKKIDVIDGEEFQIKNLLTGEVSYLEYSEDDEVEIFITLSEVTPKEVASALPMATFEFLRNEVNDFTLNGTDYYYDDDWSCRFVRNGKGLADSEMVKMVEFASEDETRYLTFEFWLDGSIEAFISKEIKSYEIEILSI